MVANDFQRYFQDQQVSAQWLPVLRAMALTLTEHAEPKDLHGIFFEMGQQLAQDLGAGLASAQFLTELEEGLNDYWATINWGWVTLKEEQDLITIVHQAAPLEQAFGEAALPWSVGLLEGFYHSVFKALDSGNTMSLRSTGDLSDGMELSFSLGRHDNLHGEDF